jgi:hypothetical protein
MGFALGRVGESTPLQLFGESPAGQLLSNIADGENVGQVVFDSADTSKLDSSTTQLSFHTFPNPHYGDNG